MIFILFQQKNDLPIIILNHYCLTDLFHWHSKKKKTSLKMFCDNFPTYPKKSGYKFLTLVTDFDERFGELFVLRLSVRTFQKITKIK